MKKILLTLLAFLSMATANAEPVSRQQALKKAGQFMPGKKFSESKASTRSDVSDAFYVFNAEGNGGYVIVSGDDRTTEILGYSETGNLDMNQLPENLKWWLDGYNRQIKALGSSLQPTKKAETRSAGSKAVIQPLIKTHWNQGNPYNLMCPDWKGRDWRDDGFATDNEGNYSVDNICVTGCVATAMAQIMYYHQYPKSCPAIPEYKKKSNGWNMKALPAMTFDWESIKETYKESETDASATAVATLFRYCGQAVSMDYDLGGSEAGLYPNVLINVFGYSKNIRIIYRDVFTTSQWEDIIYGELAAGRPVLYSGQADVGGHQFIVDGYDGKGLFHMNWGWGGMSDDYFVLSLADPDSQGIGGSASGKAFQYSQDALIGVQPPTEGEVLLPQLESSIIENTTATYNRASKDADFTEVQFDGFVYAHYNVLPTEGLSVQLGWALCQNDQIKRVVSSFSDAFGTGKIYPGIPTTRQATFGAGLELGKYQICQVYRYSDDDAWTLCVPYHDTSFFVAEVTETTLTVRQTQPSFTVNSITVPEYPSAGSPMDVSLNVTNDGETFEQVVNLWVQKEGESTWTKVSTTTRKIDPGKSGDVVITYKPSAVGTYTLKATKTDSQDALKTTTVTVYATINTTINNIKYECNTGAKTAKVVGNTFTSSDSPAAAEIPATLTDNGIEYTVKEIADKAFMYCSSLASLTIPSSVEFIGDDAFFNCFHLEEVTIPEGVKHIGEMAFSYCDLKTVVSAMNNPCAIDESVFMDSKVVDGEYVDVFTSANLFVPIGKKDVYAAADVWKNFSNIYQGELKESTVEGITYEYATGEDFATVKKGDASVLKYKEVTIPSTISIGGNTYNVKKIDDWAFYQVYIKALTIQEGVEEIGNGSFYNNADIKDLVLPASVKRIGEGAFQYCFGLTTIKLPTSLSSIGDYAFGNTKNLTSVVSYIANPFAIAENVFGIENGDNLTPPTATLSVPKDTKTKYESTAGWKKFPSTVEMDIVIPTVDVETIVNCIMSGEYQENADLNNDSKVNAADLVLYLKSLKK